MLAATGREGYVETEGSTGYGLREEGCWGCCYMLLTIA